ncbi:MAG: hypothetical protein ACLRZH_14780 [Ruthenibacterium lactatiformans]
MAKTVHNLHERAVRKAAARREEQAQSAASEELRVYGGSRVPICGPSSAARKT